MLGGGLAIGQSLWGASVDNVLGIDVVTTWLNDSADWDIVRINATSEPDLYWGMLVSCFTYPRSDSCLFYQLLGATRVHSSCHMLTGIVDRAGLAVWPLFVRCSTRRV